ncbi:hypothetical protein KAU11_01885, partial [Candidatus Babeliales bacterium]|nr:hypothetical protein [Candidatus Babeliales bacterium]
MVMINWYNSQLLWFIGPIFAILIASTLYVFKHNSISIKKLSNKHHRKLLLPKSSHFRRITKFILLLTSLTAFFIGFIQPQWGKKEQTVTHEGRDILVALDISRSMLAKDISPSRIEFT